jgi:hypothetical protein
MGMTTLNRKGMSPAEMMKRLQQKERDMLNELEVKSEENKVEL